MKSRSFGALKRLKSLYYMSATAVPLLLGGVALAVAPTAFDYGAYYGSSQILKGDISDLDKGIFQMRYDGSYQEFCELQKAYANIGKVYYKLGKGGTWSNEAPHLKYVGQYDVYYYVDGDPNYNDLGSALDPKHVVVNVVDWGRKVINNGIINYVDSTGKTSAEVNKNGVIWVKEESNGKSGWFGLDNSSGTFEKGSRFWVKILDKESDSGAYEKYFAQLDDANKEKVREGKLWIFLTGVTKPDGVTEYGRLPIRVPYYIQLGSDWGGDISALFISQGADVPMELKFDSVANFKNRYGGLEFPTNTGSYARILLGRFGPCAVLGHGTEESSDVDGSEADEGNVIECNGEKGNVKSAGKHGKGYSYKNVGDNVSENSSDVSDIYGLDDYGIYDDQRDTNEPADIPESWVEFFKIEEIALILLLSVLDYVSKFAYRRNAEKKFDEKNKSR